ncbi:MAG: toll/interleukin-1 receptor domain-containing protein [Spirochaetota bacterium]
MSSEAIRFKIPGNIDFYLAALSMVFSQEGKRSLQELIVNAKIRIEEGYSYDNWDGGIYGHALHLVVPEKLFLKNIKQRNEIQIKIKEELNKLHDISNEFFDIVFLEMEMGEENDWRKDSGLQLTGNRMVLPNTTKRIWNGEGYRVFLSHKSDVKKETAELKDQLCQFGISCFVAHKDITPTKKWQDEIENALASMDAFVALMTADFHDSDWTDQEVGFAFARNVPIVAVRLGKDPYGFIGKFQGLSSAWSTAAIDIVKVFIKHERMFLAYIQALRKCRNYDMGNTLSAALPGIETLTSEQVDKLIAAYNETSELRGSYAFNGKKPYSYGAGLVHHLNRFDTRQFQFSANGRIKLMTENKW